MVLKGIPSGGTRVEVEELWQEKAILDFEVWKLFFADKTMTENFLIDGTTQKQHEVKLSKPKTLKPKFIQDKINNLDKYMKFMQAFVKTMPFYSLLYYKSLQSQR